MVMYEYGYEAVIGDQPLRAEFFYDPLDCLGIVALCGQLTFELLRSMLAPREQTHGGNLDRLVIVGCHGGWRLGAGARSAPSAL